MARQLMAVLLGLTALLGALPLGADSAAVRFVEVSQRWGIDFRHHHGGSGARYMVETMVGGVVLLDYDDDGDVDVLLVDGGPLPGYLGMTPRTRLYRNDRGRFLDVSERAGLGFQAYGCGGAAGDYDNDGDVDVYLTAFGKNALLGNQGDGTFVEVGEEAGVADELWSASASFADIDRDGDLDLFVTNYVDFALDNHKFCGNEAEGVRGYCHPDSYQGQPDRLYRNDGEGRFAEVAQELGLTSAREAGLGVVFSDLDGDLFPELYVANDLDPNLLFHNRGEGFEDVSLVSGTAYSHVGKPEAGMGVESADLDGDGRFDLVVTNFALETNALYRNNGGLLFVDRRFPSRLAEPSLRFLGFGVAALDVEHDGDLDLVIANGHILDNAEQLKNAIKEYAQRNQLMLNRGDGSFEEAQTAGLDQVRVSRGLAYGDLDLDGDLDLVINNSNQPVEVYENRSEGSGTWLLVDLVGRRSNRFGIGSRLSARAGDRSLVRERRTASSYLSQNAWAVHFGLGDAESADLEVRWPSGKVQRIEGLPARHRVLIYE